MTAYVQGTSPILLTTPLGADKLIVREFHGEELLSGLFYFQLEMVSQDNEIDFKKLVGKQIALTMTLTSGKKEIVNGIVAAFRQSGKDARFTYYSAEIRPWLWLMTMNSDCRIFQNQTVQQIIQKIFSDLGFADYKFSLTASYVAREFCVQYMETSFAFVSRLMEEEGIFYFFDHTDSHHQLVIADSPDAHPASQIPTVEMRPAEGKWEAEDSIMECSMEERVVVGQYKTDDYNFEAPETDILVTASADETKRSIYEYPADHLKKDEAEKSAERALETYEVPAKVLRGVGSCKAMRGGQKFTLSGHSRQDLNDQYILKSVSHRFDQQNNYSNTFEAIPAATKFRPERSTAKPRIVGAQTALVTGKSGEEIWTDQYGRIKVKFYWDQSAPRDETSSCWIRVAQGWAGKQWGSLFIPRIGQEVVVSFLEGNPDRPLVTGSVYNANQTAPYALPSEQTKSTVKSNSSKGGSGFNELRFEDKKDSEEFFIQAQKDMNTTVLNDQTTTVKNNRTVTVQEKNEALIVDKGDRSIKVNTGKETHEVKGTREVTVTGKETHTNKADFLQNVSGGFTLKVSGNIMIEATGSVVIKAGTSFVNQAGTALTNTAGTTLENTAGISLTNKGSASATVDGGAMLALKGGLVKIN